MGEAGEADGTALILRELRNKGELGRGLMIAPAVSVNIWQRELSEMFNLDFGVVASEGDIIDRETNAFAKAWLADRLH